MDAKEQEALVAGIFKRYLYTYLATPKFYSEFPHRIEDLSKDVAASVLAALKTTDGGVP